MLTLTKLHHDEKKAKKYIIDSIDRLNFECEESDEVLKKIALARAVTKVSSKIIATGNLVARAKYASENLLIGNKILPEILE